MEVILAQYHRETADDALVTTLLASVTQSSSVPVTGVRRRTRRQERKAADAGDGAEGVEAGSDPRSEPEAGPEGEAAEEGEGGEGGEGEKEGDGKEEVEPEGGDDGDDAVESDSDAHRPPPPGRGRPATVAKQAATVKATGSKQARVAPTASRPATAPAPQLALFKRLAHCIACTTLNDLTERTPSFCFECGNAWGVPVGKSNPPVGVAATTTTTMAVTPTPTTWAGAASFRPSPASSLVPASHSRTPGLAQLDERTIKHAREGKQHYTLADLLPLRAEDESSASSAGLSESAILLDARDGVLISAFGAAATSARTAPARRRAIAGFSDITEIIVFSLIGIIYVDRPDIGQQLLRLLFIAQDLTRAYGWNFALRYIDLVRSKFHHSDGGQRGQHCLLINTVYDMGVRDRLGRTPTPTAATPASANPRGNQASTPVGVGTTAPARGSPPSVSTRTAAAYATLPTTPLSSAPAANRAGPLHHRVQPARLRIAQRDSPASPPSRRWRRQLWVAGSSRTRGAIHLSTRRTR